MFLEVENLIKYYGEGENRMQVLKGISTGVEKGEMCVIQGPSGSGKSTFLNCIGGLEIPDGGSINVDGTQIVGMKPGRLSDYRRDKLGFIFQFYNLVPDLTVRENIEVCDFLSANPLEAAELMETLGIAGIGDKFPAQLSGGQQQRVAIARAIAARPPLILADEPTGSLDRVAADACMELLSGLNRDGHTVILITHDALCAAAAQRRITLRDGQITEDSAG